DLRYVTSLRVGADALRHVMDTREGAAIGPLTAAPAAPTPRARPRDLRLNSAKSASSSVDAAPSATPSIAQSQRSAARTLESAGAAGLVRGADDVPLLLSLEGDAGTGVAALLRAESLAAAHAWHVGLLRILGEYGCAAAAGTPLQVAI